MAGCILVDFENLQVINRSHAYKNVYVHRRDSVSISKLSEQEIQDRKQLGLITETQSYDDDDDDEHDEDEEENWDEFSDTDESSDEEQYTLSGRKSSVQPIHCVSSPLGNMQGVTSSFKFENVPSNHVTSSRATELTSITEDDEDTLREDETMTPMDH